MQRSRLWATVRGDWSFMASVAGLCALYMLLALALLPIDGFYSPDSGLKWLQVKSLRFVADLVTALPYPGRSYDPELQSIPLGESFFVLQWGEVELVWPPWFALLSWPWHSLLGVRGMHVMPALCAIACAIAVAQWTSQLLGREFRNWALFGTALATPLIVYGVLVWEHAIATFLALLGAWQWLEGVRHGRRGQVAAAGLCFALAIALRVEVLLLCAALGLVLLFAGARERRDLWLFALVVMAVSAPFVLWNELHMGELLPANAGRNYSRVSWLYLRASRAEVFSDFFWGVRGVWPGLGVAAALLAIIAGRVRAARVRVWALGVFALAACVAVYRCIATRSDAVHGYLEVAPAVLLALCARPGASPEPQPLQLTAARVLVLLQRALLVYLGLYLSSAILLSSNGPSGGREWGPRFLLSAYPLAVPLVVDFVARARAEAERATFALALLLIGLGGAMQLGGLAVIERFQRASSAQSAWMTHIPLEDPIVAPYPNWWVPGLLVSEFDRRPMFVVREPVAWNSILLRALRAGRQRVWLAGHDLPAPAAVRAYTVPEIGIRELMPSLTPGFSVRCLELKCLSEEVCGDALPTSGFLGTRTHARP